MAQGPLRLWQRSDWLWTLLPVLVMGVLAAWSFWLVRTSDAPIQAPSSLAVTSEPDMVLERFVARTYNAQGTLSSWIKGNQAWHHPADDSLIVSQADMTSFRGDVSRPATVTAQAREMWVNGAQTVYKLSGQVRVQKIVTPSNGEPEKTTFWGEELRIDEDRSTVSSELPVILFKGRQRLQGDRLLYDESEGVMTLRGRVVWQQPYTGSEPS